MLRLGIVIVACLLAVSPLRAGEGMPAMLRRPAAIVLDESGSCLFAANRRSGTVSVVDCERREVVEELAVGERLADLALLPGGQRLLAVDEAQHELVLLSRQDKQWEVAQRLTVQPYPVSVAVAADGSRAFIASLWSRSLSVIDLQPPAQAAVVEVLPLEFAPRKLLLAAKAGKLIVSDAFGGKLAVVDLAALEVERVVEIPGHNIRGLALDRERRKLLVSHQILDGSAESTRQNVRWGAVLTDVVRWIELDSLLERPLGRPLESRVHQFGDEEGAGGDPAEAAVTSDGTLVQTLAGVGKLAIGREWESDRARIFVGRRPTDVVVDGAGRLAYVADTFGDAIAVVDVREAKKLATISLGPQGELELADRGELLFYDARLSLDGWYSCHSCHTDGHTNGRLSDNLGDGGYGAPKRVLSLLGVGDTGPWAWNGAVTSLELQIRKSIESTMQGSKPNDEQVAVLAAYLRTLEPPPALGAVPGQRDAARDSAAVERGRQVFESRGCTNCHAPPSYASQENFDVGLKDESGATRFNPPSLRGVSQRAPYFHDNRAATLSAVFREHQHPGESRYSDHELRDLLAFLGSL